MLQVCRKAALEAHNAAAAGRKIAVLSGDHSSAAGWVAGLRRAHPQRQLGLVWIDAHADLHSPWTTPSGNLHGMPLGALLGLGSENALAANRPKTATRGLWKQLCGLSVPPSDAPAPLNPANLVVLGLRSFEPAEGEFIRQNGILAPTVNQLLKQGPQAAAQSALRHLAHCDVLAVSFDTDSLDAALVPGTGTPEPGGFEVEFAQDLLLSLLADPRCVALEFTEYNPLLDESGRTLRILGQVLKPALESWC